MNETLDPEFKAKWVAALRSGEYKQGRRSLCNNSLRGEHKYCCLGVAYVIAKHVNPPDTYTGYIFGSFPRFGGGVIDTTGVPELLIGTGSFPEDGKYTRRVLAKMNDEGKSFSDIADYIERNL